MQLPRCFQLLFVILIGSLFGQQALVQAKAQDAEKVTLTIRDVIERNALWFEADGSKAVVLAHQSGATAKSWTPFAKKLQAHQIAAIATSGVSGEDIEAAVAFLVGKGFTDITLIGASLGGGGVQQAVAKLAPGSVTRTVLLAPSPGKALENPDMDKLFIYTRNDFYRGRAVESFEKAAEPKILLELPGSLHAQDMLSGPHARLIEQTVLEFIKD